MQRPVVGIVGGALLLAAFSLGACLRTPPAAPPAAPLPPSVTQPKVGEPIVLATTTNQATAPTIAVHGEQIWVVWDEYNEESEAADAFMVESSDGGQHFTAPRNLTNHGGVENPYLAVAADGTLLLGYMAWAAEPVVDDFYPNWMEIQRSTDGGQSWQRLGQTPDPATLPIQIGLPTMAASADGQRILFMWKDATPADYRPAAMPGQITGTESIPLWAAVSLDGGQSFSPPQVAAASACSCCGAQAFFQGATPAVAFRGLTFIDDQHDQRDPTIARMNDDGAWAAPIEVYDDAYTLELAGCPASGPGVDYAAGVTQVAWWTGVTARQGFWLAAADADHFDAPRLIKPTSSPARDLALAIAPDGSTFVLLVENEPAPSQAPYLKLFHVTGDRATELEAVRLAYTNSYAPLYDLQATATGVLLTWVEIGEKTQQVKLRRIDLAKS